MRDAQAHLVWQWGSDFRPYYAEIGRWCAEELAGVKRLALTATAPRCIHENLLGQLCMLPSTKVLCSTIYRPNIALRVYHRCGEMRCDLGWLAKELRDDPELTLIYVPTKKLAEKVREIPRDPFEITPRSPSSMYPPTLLGVSDVAASIFTWMLECWSNLTGV